MRIALVMDHRITVCLISPSFSHTGTPRPSVNLLTLPRTRLSSLYSYEVSASDGYLLAFVL